MTEPGLERRETWDTRTGSNLVRTNPGLESRETRTPAPVNPGLEPRETWGTR